MFIEGRMCEDTTHPPPREPHQDDDVDLAALEPVDDAHLHRGEPLGPQPPKDLRLLRPVPGACLLPTPPPPTTRGSPQPVVGWGW